MTPEELTREYIEEMLQNGPGSAGMSDEEAESLYRLALIATDPQAEADRRLGAAVREAVMAGDVSANGIDVLESMATDCDTRTRWTTPGEVLRTIADTLREEAGR